MDSSKRMLIVVDEAETACKAVDYVSEILSGRSDFEVALLHFVPPLPLDTFESEEERDREQDRLENEAAELLEMCRARLIEQGQPEEMVFVRKHIRDCPSLAECVIDEQQAFEYGTVVVGRQSLSRIEEFLMGSVSTSLVRLAERCAIWVVARESEGQEDE